MTKPKVLFILHLPPPMHGAAMVGKYIQQSKVVNEAFDADYIDLATNRILNQSGKGSLKKIGAFARIIRQVIHALKHNKYDLCYMTLTAAGAGFYKDAVIASILKRWSSNTLYHFHNKGVSGKGNNIPEVLYRYVFKNTRSILVSRYLYSDIKPYVKEQNVFYCPCGVPADKPYAEAKKDEKQETGESVCQLLFLSNMIREKGIFVLLDACEKLHKQGLRFECHYVGGWFNVPEETFARLINEKNLSDVVFAHGPKYKDDKTAFYRKADVFVFPTYYDTFGLVNLEAMQNGLPVVSTYEGGIPDIVQDGKTGFLVPQQSADVLAEKLAILIKDASLRYSMGEAGRRRFYDWFTLDIFEKNFTRVIQEAIQKKQTDYSLSSVL